MSTVFGALDAHDEGERRVPQPGALKNTAEHKERQANGCYGIPTRPATPEGWSPAAWRLYLEDPDGGRAACRYSYTRPPDTTPSAAERLSWED